MNKIEFPRKGFDSKLRSQTKFEGLFLGDVLTTIGKSLDVITTESQWSSDEVECVKLIKKHLRFILIAQPRYLEIIIRVMKKKYPTLFKSKTPGSFNKRVLKAFGYNGYRKDLMVTLAKWLNIRCCPYCNAQFTLYLYKRVKKYHPHGIAKFQFDHFFNESDYPYLSMSLYNLIPVCTACNHSKLKVDLSVELNPYETDIASLFSFRAKDPLRLWQGATIKDAMPIRMVPKSRNTAKLVKELNDNLFFEKQYARFWDVAQEEFDKVYLYPYYSQKGNFPMLTATAFDKVTFKQLWFDRITEREDIERLPLAKFRLDIREQACAVLGRMIL